MRAFIALVILVVWGAAATADPPTYSIEASSWIDEPQSLPHPKLADIGVPRRVGTLALRQLKSFGSARDVYAQYQSDDNAIQATIYIYQNGYADALLARWITDHVIAVRFSTELEPSSPTIVAAGGRSGVAYRSLFRNGFTPSHSTLPEGPTATAAAYLHTTFSLVKLRVSGPVARRADVVADLDALLAGLHFEKKDAPLPVGPGTFTDCASNSESFWFADHVSLPMTPAMGAGMELIGGESVPDGSPRAYCIVSSDQDPNSMGAVLRRAGKDDGDRIALLGDSGTTLIVKRMASLDTRPAARFLTLLSTRGFQLFGPYPGTPTGDQLLALGKGSRGWLGVPLAGVSFDESGNYKVNINTGRMIEDTKGKKP